MSFDTSSSSEMPTPKRSEKSEEEDEEEVEKKTDKPVRVAYKREKSISLSPGRAHLTTRSSESERKKARFPSALSGAQWNLGPVYI